MSGQPRRRRKKIRRRNCGGIVDATVAISAAKRLKGTAVPSASRNHSSALASEDLHGRSGANPAEWQHLGFLVPVCQPRIGKGVCLGQLIPGHVVGIDDAEKRGIVGAQRVKNVIPLLGFDAVA